MHTRADKRNNNKKQFSPFTSVSGYSSRRTSRPIYYYYIGTTVLHQHYNRIPYTYMYSSSVYESIDNSYIIVIIIE